MESLYQNLYFTLNKMQEKQETRTRLTKKLIHIVVTIADHIAKTTEPSENSVFIEELGHLKIFNVESPVSDLSKNYMFITDSDNVRRVFTDEADPGKHFYFANDMDFKLDVATKEQFLGFINSLPLIISRFDQEQDRILEQVKRGFEYLKTIAGA